MSGFASSALRFGASDLGSIYYAVVLDQARNTVEAIKIRMIAHGYIGYGNAMNVKRTVSGLASASCAAVLIENQIAPKFCGHTQGKESVSREKHLI